MQRTILTLTNARQLASALWTNHHQGRGISADDRDFARQAEELIMLSQATRNPR